MKRLLIFVLFSVSALAQIQVGVLSPASGGGGGGGTVTFVQSKESTLGTPLSIVLASPTTAGNLLTVMVMADIGSTPSVSMTGETFTNASPTSCATGFTAYMFYAKNLAGGQTTVSITGSGGGNNIYAHVAEWHGASTTSPLDGAVVCATGNSNAPSVTSGSPSGTDIAVSFMRIDAASTLTVPTGWTTILNTGTAVASAYKSTSTAVTAAWGSTGSAAWFDYVYLLH